MVHPLLLVIGGIVLFLGMMMPGDSIEDFEEIADRIYCQLGGNCNISNLVVNNLTVVGTFLNVTVTNFNVNGSMNITGCVNFPTGTELCGNYIYLVGNMTAEYYYGDGSQLTGIQQGALTLFFLDKNSSCAHCENNKTLSSIRNDTEVTLEGTALPDGITPFADWITDPHVPAVSFILPGNWIVYVDGMQTAGTKTVQFFYEVYKTNLTGDNEKLLSTSVYSPELTGVRQSFIINTFFNGTATNATDRIRVKGYAYVSGVGAAPTVEAYIQGASEPRIVIPVGAISVENFVPYTGAIKNVDLGDNNLTCRHGYTEKLNVSTWLAVDSPADFFSDAVNAFRFGTSDADIDFYIDPVSSDAFFTDDLTVGSNTHTGTGFVEGLLEVNENVLIESDHDTSLYITAELVDPRFDHDRIFNVSSLGKKVIVYQELCFNNSCISNWTDVNHTGGGASISENYTFMNLNVSRQFRVGGNTTLNNLNVTGEAEFSGDFNKSVLRGYGNVKIGGYSNSYGTVSFESDPFGGSNTVWTIDNAGGNIRIYDSTPGSDGHARFRISNQGVIVGESVAGKRLNFNITGDFYSENNLEVFENSTLHDVNVTDDAFIGGNLYMNGSIILSNNNVSAAQGTNSPYLEFVAHPLEGGATRTDKWRIKLNGTEFIRPLAHSSSSLQFESNINGLGYDSRDPILSLFDRSFTGSSITPRSVRVCGELGCIPDYYSPYELSIQHDAGIISLQIVNEDNLVDANDEGFFFGRNGAQAELYSCGNDAGFKFVGSAGYGCSDEIAEMHHNGNLSIPGNLSIGGSIQTDQGCHIPFATFWAEEGGALSTGVSGGLQFSYGNGAVAGHGVVHPCAGRVVWVALSCDSSSSNTGRVDIVINGAAGSTCDVITPVAGDTASTSTCDLAFSADDLLTPRTTTNPAAASTDCITTWNVIYD